MAREVAWGRSALQDLQQAAVHIAKDSQHYAQALVDKAATAAEMLVDFPQIGRRVPRLGDDALRELFVQSYRLIYEVRSESIQILAFVHGARDLQALWDREGDARRSEVDSEGESLP